jgi:hypothetical protein
MLRQFGDFDGTFSMLDELRRRMDRMWQGLGRGGAGRLDSALVGERGAVTFSRAFSLPVVVDADKTTAVVKDGVLRITLAEAPEAQPRKIGVQAR